MKSKHHEPSTLNLKSYERMKIYSLNILQMLKKFQVFKKVDGEKMNHLI
jgi:hypothetical protein